MRWNKKRKPRRNNDVLYDLREDNNTIKNTPLAYESKEKFPTQILLMIQPILLTSI